MELRGILTQEEITDCVKSYENVALHAQSDIVLIENPLTIRFEGVRRSKLVVIEARRPISEIINDVLLKTSSLVDKDNSLSENIEIFTISLVPDSLRLEYSSLFMKNGLSLTITDRIQMERLTFFKQLFSDEDCSEDFDCSLYDYLSMSNETFDVKNSLFYALLLMMIYQNQPIQRDVLELRMNEKYGKNFGDVSLALKELRRQNKISLPGKGGAISLTSDESTRLEQSIKEERSNEEVFKNRFNRIIQKYNVKNGDKVLELLRDAYKVQYLWHSQSDDDEKKKEELGREHLSKLEAFVVSQIGNQTVTFIKELQRLCNTSDFLSRYSLSHLFLDLYRSSSYEKYINNKDNYIILDTPVLTSYLCYLTKYDELLDSEWDNSDYQSVKSLARLRETSKGKILFSIPFDYLQETVGELKKALQFSWFDQIELAIPFETGNTFYNFFIFVKSSRQAKGENVKDFSFQRFAAEYLKLEETNPDSSLFNKKTLSYLKYFFQKSGSVVLDPLRERYDVFDKVKIDYEFHLHYIDKKKTIIAVNSDVRQALYIANETTYEDRADTNFFIATWDKSLRKLRDIVNDEMHLMSSYSVMNPANLANKLSFRSFSLSGKGVSDDVFAYADSGYNLVAKVQSLYDNVLTPYFANANNHNAILVETMLKMERGCQDSESREDSRANENTVLADIFLPIVYALPKNDLSAQNLREFLADENNNDFVINLFQEAFDEYAQGHTLDISDRFCDEMKTYLMKNEVEIKL